MKILSFKVILSAIYSDWVKDEATITESDRPVYEQQIRELYKKVGLDVVDIRLSWTDEPVPVPFPPEPEVDVSELEQYKNKPRMSPVGKEKI